MTSAMTSYMAKTISKKLLKEHAGNNFGRDDPMYEEVEATDRRGKPTGKMIKVKKGVPSGISQENAKVLNKVRRRAHRLDSSINICGIKFGVSSIIALIPGFGDFIDVFMAYMVFLTCCQVKPDLPNSVKSKMMSNIVLDFFLGLVPFLGDIADTLFRANMRNAKLLEEVLREGRYQVGTPENLAALRKSKDHLSKTKQAIEQSGSPRNTSEQHTRASNGHAHTSHDTRHTTEEFGPPPRYESGLGRHDGGTHTGVSEPAPAKLTKEKSSGGSWLNRFGSRRQQEPDLELGGVRPPAQPPRP